MTEERHIPLSMMVLIAVLVITVTGALIAINTAGNWWARFAAAAVTVIVASVAGGFLFWLVRRLEESELRLNTVVESAADGIITVDKHGIIETFNNAAVAMFGYRPGEVKGNHFATLLPARHASWRDDAEQPFGELLRAHGMTASGGVIALEGLRRDGTTFHMDLSVNAAWIHDRLVYTLIIRDVSERVAAQAALRRARDELEQRVEERTADLRQVNAQLRDEIEERKRVQEERERLITELRAALSQIKTLRGLLPICASCKKIRDDKGYWNQIEVYVRERSEAEFSHSICPECMARLYPELLESHRQAGGPTVDA